MALSRSCSLQTRDFVAEQTCEGQKPTGPPTTSTCRGRSGVCRLAALRTRDHYKIAGQKVNHKAPGWSPGEGQRTTLTRRNPWTMRRYAWIPSLTSQGLRQLWQLSYPPCPATLPPRPSFPCDSPTRKTSSALVMSPAWDLSCSAMITLQKMR